MVMIVMNKVKMSRSGRGDDGDDGDDSDEQGKDVAKRKRR
jgi:hypothetical protein